MKIFIDIGHPAHVHYFKNFIDIMKHERHEFFITARDKEVSHDLLRAYDIEYFNRGVGKVSLFGKLLYTLKADYLLYKHARQFGPDLFLSFSSPYAAHVSKLLGKPHIAFDDTEHATFARKFYLPFTDVVLTPSCFKIDLGIKHTRFDGLMELSYLHPNYFSPDPKIFEYLRIDENQKYVILRFISWGAQHDKGHSGISEAIKIRAVKEFEKYAKVFISSEGPLPADLSRYRIDIPVHLIHHALYYSSLYFGESGTMATESAILGIPTVRVSTLSNLLGNFNVLHDQYQLIDFFENDVLGFESALSLLKNPHSKNIWKEKADVLIKEKIDVTQFMVDFIEKWEKGKL